MTLDFLFATDLHGDLDKMRALVKKAIDMDVDLIILGGDLFRSGRSNTIDRQRDLLKNDIGPIFQRFPGEILTIFGNNDWYATSSKIGELAPDIIPIEGCRYDAGEGLKISGFSYVPASPFMIKDWELLEIEAKPLPGARFDGLCSRSGEVEECEIDGTYRILDLLDGIPEIKGELLISHTPPAGTNCSLGSGGNDLGSMDLRRWIESKGPVGVLCGHIHEAPERSGHMLDMVDDIHIGNPGSFWDRLSCIRGVWDGELHLEPLYK